MTTREDAALGSLAHGVAVWSSATWLRRAVAWVDAELLKRGIQRIGELETPRVRPWAAVLRVATNRGPVWFKATGPGTASEVLLYDILVRATPSRVLEPIASDPALGWLLLPDGGPPLGERLGGHELAEAMTTALAQYGELQRALAAHVADMLDAGVSDMRPSRMLERFDEALRATAALIDAHGSPDDHAMHTRVAGLAASVARDCDKLAHSSVPISLDHNDLHAWNILGQVDQVRFYDWGDSVVAHSFAAMLVPLGVSLRLLKTTLDDPRLLRMRDAYLEGFGESASRRELTDTLETACRVAKIARTLTWNRALCAALDQGDAVDREWVLAPIKTLASLLDESYIGGA